MKSRPILFSSSMILALLDGRKTQTRRLFFALVGSRPVYGRGFPRGCCAYEGDTDDTGWPLAQPLTGGAPFRIPCPYGNVGDALYVRETWAPHPQYAGMKPKTMPRHEAIYRASSHMKEPWAGGRWRPAIHMPRWASRITLEVTGVRAEHLQDISEEDARAEGMPSSDGHPVNGLPTSLVVEARDEFRRLWDKLNSERAPWDNNPFVWVLSFKRLTP